MKQSSFKSNDDFHNLELACERLRQVLEQEHEVLKASNGLTGKGIDKLEQIHQQKDSFISELDQLSSRPDISKEREARTDIAQRVRERIEACKALQIRNHQIFGRIVAAQRRILSALRESDDSFSLYDKVGRSQDFGARSEVIRA